ncbi:MAG: prepilin-type N-terminal cleavage/methylation domain-containing protein [Deltaproteobacteria bacterium]|nr:prepilin-type N-terminal cleavage/methylation domain-containing protein [Deltaproteobacteria bacterium]
MVSQIQSKRSVADSRGFTLVELLIVVAIISILSAIALPMFSRYTENAHRASMVSDAKNISRVLEFYFIQNQTYVTPVTSVGPGPATAYLDGVSGYLAMASSANTINISGTLTTYSISVANSLSGAGKSPFTLAVNASGATICTWADGSGC